MPKRDRNTEHAVPECDLHHAENGDRDKIRKTVARQLLARIFRDQPELRQGLPDKGDRSRYLHGGSSR